MDKKIDVLYQAGLLGGLQGPAEPVIAARNHETIEEEEDEGEVEDHEGDEVDRSLVSLPCGPECPFDLDAYFYALVCSQATDMNPIRPVPRPSHCQVNLVARVSCSSWRHSWLSMLQDTMRWYPNSSALLLCPSQIRPPTTSGSHLSRPRRARRES